MCLKACHYYRDVQVTETAANPESSTLSSRYPRGAALIAGLFYAIGMILAFPPFDVWPLVFGCCVPLFWVISTSVLKARTLAMFAAMGVMPFWMYEEFWISRITGAGYIPMCLLLVSYSFVAVFLTAFVMRRKNLKYCAIPAALIWCGVHVLRGEIVADGYPWYFEGHPLAGGPIGSFGAITGAYGVTLVVLLINTLIADGVRLRKPALVTAWILLLVFGTWVLQLTVGLLPGGSLKDVNLREVRIACVQTNVPQEIKMGGGIASQIAEWNVLEDLTRKAANAKPSMIVWPETMKPGLSLDVESLQAERAAGLIFRYQDANGSDKRIGSTKFADDMLTMQKEIGVPLIVGEEAFEGLRFPTDSDGGVRLEYDKRYNSAFVVSDGVAQPDQYNKLHLTPFGEYMPYIRSWPWLQKQLLAFGANGMSFDLAEGVAPVQLRVNVTMKGTTLQEGDVQQVLRIATPICFEIADSPTVRKLATGADLMITLTNDGWFGDSDKTRQQHVQLARWRAIETGIPVVRCANTGISCAIDGNGGFVRAAEGFAIPNAREPGILMVDMPVANGSTVYMSGGWTTPWIILAGMAGLLVWGLFGKPGPVKVAEKAP